MAKTDRQRSETRLPLRADDRCDLEAWFGEKDLSTSEHEESPGVFLIAGGRRFALSREFARCGSSRRSGGLDF